MCHNVHIHTHVQAHFFFFGKSLKKLTEIMSHQRDRDYCHMRRKNICNIGWVSVHPFSLTGNSLHQLLTVCGSKNLNEYAFTAGICLPYDSLLEEVQLFLFTSVKGIHFTFQSLLMDKIINEAKNPKIVSASLHIYAAMPVVPPNLSRNTLNSVSVKDWFWQ